MYTLMLYNGATKKSDDMNRNILILTNALILNAVVGEFGSLLVMDKFLKLTTGKKHSVVEDFKEKSSQDISVMYNEIVGLAAFFTTVFVLNGIYKVTGNHLVSITKVVFVNLWLIGITVYNSAKLLKIKQKSSKSFFGKLFDPLFLPPIICMIQVLLIRKKWIEYIYCNIYRPQNKAVLILVLIIVLSYFFIVSFCHFCNIYCLIGFRFQKTDFKKNTEKTLLYTRKRRKY